MSILQTLKLSKQLKRPLTWCKYARCKSARVHTSILASARMFVDRENVYAYNVLRNIPVVSKNLYPFVDAVAPIGNELEFNNVLDQEWRTKSAGEITECFKRMVPYCVDKEINLSDCRFDKLVDGLLDRVQDLTDGNLSDLLECLVKLPPCDSYSSHNFHDVWSALDDVCCWRSSDWPTDTLFLFADHWYRLNLAKLSDYVGKFIERVVRRILNLNREHLVHLFFYMRAHKRIKPPFDCQSAFDGHVSQMSIEEIAVVSMGYLRFEARIKLASTADAMIRTTKQALRSADDFCIGKVLHVLRYSSHVLLVDQLMDLLDHLTPEIPRLSNTCCIHAALLGTTLQFFHENSLRGIAQKIVGQIDDVRAVRLKDMERLLLALTMFNFDPDVRPDIFRTIYEEIHKDDRRQELAMYPRCLPSVLNFLSLRNVYSDALMNQMLDKDRVLELYGKHPKCIPRDLFSLDVCIDVERPEYVGNRLDPTFRRRIAKWNVEYTPTWDQHKKLTQADRFILDVIETVAKIVNGHRNLLSEHLLPNYAKSDIVVCKDADGHFRQPAGFEVYTLGDVVRPTRRDWRWFSVVPVNWNMCIRNTSHPLGLVLMKIRQLRVIGYIPVLVIWNEFLPLNEKDRIEYVRNKIT